MMISYRKDPQAFRAALNQNKPRVDDEHTVTLPDTARDYRRNDWYNDVTNPMSPLYQATHQNQITTPTSNNDHLHSN
jgi:hypothetical protein